MISNKERHSIAEKLRKLASKNRGELGSMRQMYDVMIQGQEITGTIGLPSAAHVLERYADLIDPFTSLDDSGKEDLYTVARQLANKLAECETKVDCGDLNPNVFWKYKEDYLRRVDAAYIKSQAGSKR